MSRKTSWVLLCLASVVMAGCVQRFSATATQPNPLKNPKETLGRSETLVIELKDMDMEDFVLPNKVYFKIVSKDRLRFHVRLIHKWEEHADITGWDVWLEDETGKRYRPESKEKDETKHKTKMIDYDIRAVELDDFGNITRIKRDPRIRQPVLLSYDVFRGRGDYVFYHPGIFTKERRMMRLVMKRNGVELSYRWDFADGVIELNHYRQGRGASLVAGPEVRPGPITGGF